MVDHLLDQLLLRHRRDGLGTQQVLDRIRQADSRLTAIYRCSDVQAGAAYGDPWIRAAYLLRYHPHYTLQIGDLLHDLEGDPQVSELFAMPELCHIALCGGPAPEAIALAVLHQQGGGRRLLSTVFDQQAPHWSDCWPISASVARAFAAHPHLEIQGLQGDLSRPPSSEERQLLGRCQILTLMNALNELMRLGATTLHHSLALRLQALPPGALVLISDQSSYQRCIQGMALLRSLLQARGARLLICRTAASQAHAIENRFELPERLRGVYNQPADSSRSDRPPTFRYRIRNEQLQLAAVLR